MQKQGSAPRTGVVVAHGYGVKVYVERGHLVVHDGVGRVRQTRRFARATGGLRRLVIIGHTGFVTFEAARWLRDIGAAYMQLDTTGEVLLCLPRTSTEPSGPAARSSSRCLQRGRP